METRITAIVTALLAMAIGVQAEVKLKPSNASTDGVASYVYTFTDVAVVPPPTSGEPNNNSGLFSGGSGSLVVTYTALFGWTNSAAMDATNAFGSYIDGLTNALVSVGADDWGADSSSVAPSDPDTQRLNPAEVAVFTFNTLGVTAGDLSLNGISLTTFTLGDTIDVVLYDPGSDTVLDTVWDFSQSGADFTLAFTNELQNEYQLIIGAQPGTGPTLYRIDGLFMDISLPASLTNIPPTIITPVVSNSLVVLDWLDDPSPAVLDYYNVYRSLSSNGIFEVIGTSPDSAYNDFVVTNDVTYYYKATAVSTGSIETAFGNMVSATPAIPVPTGLIATAGNKEVSLDWDDSVDYLFDSFNVYRSLVPSNYVAIASNLVGSAFTDTNVVNETLYYYAVSQDDTQGGESALSAEASAFPSKALVIFWPDNSRQGSVRSITNAVTYESVGDRTVAGNMRVGQFVNIQELSRCVLKFSIDVDDIAAAGKTTNDIESVVLRMYATQNALANSPENGSAVEVSASQTKAVNNGISASDFEDAGFSLIGDWTGITKGAPVDQWYDVDVTAAVMADLANDTPGVTAGSVFRLQLNGDTSLTNTAYQASIGISNYVTSSVIFDDNTDANPPQLRINFIDLRPGYVQWSELWLPANVSVETNDYDADGLNNLYEYGLDGDPTNGTLDPAVLPTFTAVGGGFEYIHPQRSDDTNLVYTVETTTNLVFGGWDSIGYTVGGTDVTGDTLDYVTNNVDTVEDEKFIRLKIEN